MISMHTQQNRPNYSGMRVFALLLISVLSCFSARATVLLDLSLEELVAQSMLIVEGEVTGKTVSRIDDQLYTTVTLRVDETIKGSQQEATLTLQFLGGTLDGETLEVSGQFIPETGSHGLFFINDPLGEQINPLTGWYQGYFPYMFADDGQIVLNLDGRPDLLLANANDDPRVRKLISIGMDTTLIVARFPEYALFLAADFKTAIEAIMAQQGN